MNPEKQFPTAESQQLSALAIEALQADARRSERRRKNDLNLRPAPGRRSVSMRSLFARSGSERKLSPASAPRHQQPQASSAAASASATAPSALDKNHHISSRLSRSRSFRHYRGRGENPPPLVAAARSSSPSWQDSEEFESTDDSAYVAAREVYTTVKDCLQEDEWFENMLRGPARAAASADGTRASSNNGGASTAGRATFAKARQRALEREMTEVRQDLMDDSSALLREAEVPATPSSATKPTLVLEDQESPTGTMEELLNSLENAALNRYSRTAPRKPSARKGH